MLAFVFAALRGPSFALRIMAHKSPITVFRASGDGRVSAFKTVV